MKVTVVLLCLFYSLSYGQNVVFQTLYTLGDKETNQKEYLFVSPQNGFVDQFGNFYLVEYNSSQIKKYDKNGKYLVSFGRPGEGPGEYKQIELALVNQTNRILIKDNYLRRFTYLTMDGKYIESVNYNFEIGHYCKIQTYGANLYIGISSVNANQRKHGNNFIIYDYKFNNIYSSFGHSSIFWDFKDPFEVKMDNWNEFKYAIINDNDVVVSKSFYDGKLYYFKKDNNWKVNITTGKQFKYQDYEILDRMVTKEDFKTYFGAATSFSGVVNGVKKPVTVFYRVKSIGLFVHKNKYIVNFIVNLNPGSIDDFGVDVYDINGKYLGYHKIDKDRYGTASMSNIILCSDYDGNYFMRDEINKVPIIRKFKLSIN